MNRRLALCADDFGLNAAGSELIAALAAGGRLQAVSCLVNLAPWRAAAPLLAVLPQGVSRGLHFNLTEGRPLSSALRALWPEMRSLPRLLLAAGLGRLPRAAIAAELQAQWQAFSEANDALPDFIDGHQHVHALRGVREAVLALAARHGVAVRNTGHLCGPGFAFKRQVIAACGGRTLARGLRAAGLAHNEQLVGVYDFAGVDYRRLMRGWLAGLPPRGADVHGRAAEAGCAPTLLFCHPGVADGADSAPDPIASARQCEAAYLGSADFANDLAEFKVTLAPAWPRRSSAG